MEFIEKYALSKNKKCLIIDDEADFCSIGYDCFLYLKFIPNNN